MSTSGHYGNNIENYRYPKYRKVKGKKKIKNYNNSKTKKAHLRTTLWETLAHCILRESSYSHHAKQSSPTPLSILPFLSLPFQAVGEVTIVSRTLKVTPPYMIQIGEALTAREIRKAWSSPLNLISSKPGTFPHEIVVWLYATKLYVLGFRSKIFAASFRRLKFTGFDDVEMVEY